MARTTGQHEIAIPVTPFFEKKLAELVWENCPELARQTVAGKIAMSLEIDNHVVQSLVHKELQTMACAFVKDQAEKLNAIAALELEKCLESQVTKEIRDAVNHLVNKTPLANEVGKMIRNAVNEEVCLVVNTWLRGDNKDAMVKLLESRIDTYIQEREKTK
jgi:hypothetical protein